MGIMLLLVVFFLIIILIFLERIHGTLKSIDRKLTDRQPGTSSTTDGAQK